MSRKRYTMTMGRDLADRFEATAKEQGISLGEAARRALRLYITAVQTDAKVRLVLPPTQATDEHGPVVEVILR